MLFISGALLISSGGRESYGKDGISLIIFVICQEHVEGHSEERPSDVMSADLREKKEKGV